MVLASVFFTAGPAVSTLSDTPPEEVTSGAGAPREAEADISDAECRQALDLMFSGWPERAAAYIDSLGDGHHHSPLYLLTRARVYREFLPVDDENKDDVKRMAESIYSDLDVVIDECSRRLDDGEEDPRLLLYRGWAWMFKSHIRTFERSFWTAGRDAKKGKKDLLRYLEDHPEDPIANGIMGAFLYFADTLPAAFKFISKLLFMPTGDREEGLRMMRKSCEKSSLIEIDNRTLLFSVYIAFEGRFEDGMEGFVRLRRRYPNYPAFARPFAITLPFTPQRRAETLEVIDGILEADDNAPAFQRDTGSFMMLRFSRAYADRFYDPPAGERQLEALISDAPEHPDWVVAYSNFELARHVAARGDAGRARKLLRAVLKDECGAYLHREARTMLDALDTEYAPSAVGAVGDIYSAAEGPELEAMITRLDGHQPRTVQSNFYLGDALLMAGDEDGAIAAYQAVLAVDVPVWDEAFQMIACSRLAEIYGARLQYEEAAEYLDAAPRYYHKEFLYDWLYEGRKRFYERLRNGEYTTMPTLFSQVR